MTPFDTMTDIYVRINLFRLNYRNNMNIRINNYSFGRTIIWLTYINFIFHHASKSLKLQGCAANPDDKNRRKTVRIS